MKRSGSVRKVLQSLNHYIVFFLFMAFVTTCCMMLFVQTMSRSMGVTFTEENIAMAAKLTFGNVLLLSLLCTVSDAIRREFTVKRPVKKITEAAQQMMQGDFSVRIEPVKGMDLEAGFDQIIECFNKMAEELSGTETLRTDFIANVSHELKTPLAVMQNYGTLLQKPGLSERERMEYAKAITDASRRLASLITNILKLNKLENQQIFPVAAEYDLSEQICQCLLGYEDMWEKKGINIETDIDDSVMIRSDSELLSLVWNNLFSNAMKFTEPGGTVSVSLKDQGSHVAVQVTDTGCGMSRDVGMRIFDKFYQGDTSHATQGNGLGLALVKRIIDITGSDISVESEVGKGSTFIVRMRREHHGETQKHIG
ncbi:MAG: HAMP domain-containing histidine kinase [Lachnospiraceae bacterium]|nr:HAMP domain-containing histidine kinase [Lachnospiraceae bacterium]